MNDKKTLSVFIYVFGPAALYILISELVFEAMDILWNQYLQEMILQNAGAAYMHTVLSVWSLLCLLIPAAAGCLAVRRQAQTERAAFIPAQRRRAALYRENHQGVQNRQGMIKALFYTASDEKIRRRIFPLLLCASMFLALGFNAAAVSFFPGAAPQLPAGNLPGFTGIILQALSYCFFMPYVEETVFRCILYPRLQRWCGTLTAMLACAVLFGIFHGTPLQAFYAFLMGLLFTAAYEAFGRFEVPFALHGVSNLIVLSIQWTDSADLVFRPVGALVFIGLAFCAFLTIYYILKKQKETYK